MKLIEKARALDRWFWEHPVLLAVIIIIGFVLIVLELLTIKAL